MLEQCYEEAVAAGDAAPPPPLESERSERPTSVFEGQDLVALRDGRLAAPAKVRVFSSDSVPWPKGHDELNLEGGVAIVRGGCRACGTPRTRLVPWGGWPDRGCGCLAGTTCTGIEAGPHCTLLQRHPAWVRAHSRARVGGGEAAGGAVCRWAPAYAFVNALTLTPKPAHTCRLDDSLRRTVLRLRYATT